MVHSLHASSTTVADAVILLARISGPVLKRSVLVTVMVVSIVAASLLSPRKSSAIVGLCEAGCLLTAGMGSTSCVTACASHGFRYGACFVACNKRVGTRLRECLHGCGTFGGSAGYVAGSSDGSDTSYPDGGPVHLVAARFDELGDELPGMGTATAVEFFLLDLAVPIDSNSDWTLLPWVSVGFGFPNAFDTRSIDIDMSQFTSPHGYLVRMDFIDPVTLSGVVSGHSAIIPVPEPALAYGFAAGFSWIVLLARRKQHDARVARTRSAAAATQRMHGLSPRSAGRRSTLPTL